jgi:predicted PurR-regulated permease PerM
MITLPSNPTTRVGINVAILLASVVALRLGQSIFIPTIIALLLAAVLGPGALWLHQKLRLEWTLSCLTVVSSLVLLNLLIILVFILAIPRAFQVLPRPDDTQAILQLYKNFRKNLERISPVELDAKLFPEDPKTPNEIQAFQNLIDFARNIAPDVLKQTLLYGSMWLWQWVLILFILFFLLLEGGMLTRRVVEIFGPSEEVQNQARTVLADMARHVKTYLVWRTIINFGLAVVVGAVFYFAGLNQPWTWVMLLAILNYVPYLGPLVAAIPPILDAIITVSPLGAVVIMIVYTVIIVVEGYLIVPVLMGRSMDLNATTVLLACLFWELVWGTVGLFLAMPLMAAMKAICYHVPPWRPWANLMSTGVEEHRPVILNPPSSDGTGEDKEETPVPAGINPRAEPSGHESEEAPVSALNNLLESRRGLLGFTLGALVTCTVVWMLVFVFKLL